MSTRTRCEPAILVVLETRHDAVDVLVLTPLLVIDLVDERDAALFLFLLLALRLHKSIKQTWRQFNSHTSGSQLAITTFCYSQMSSYTYFIVYTYGQYTHKFDLIQNTTESFRCT